MSGLSVWGRIYLKGSGWPIARRRALRLSVADILLLESDFV